MSESTNNTVPEAAIEAASPPPPHAPAAPGDDLGARIDRLMEEVESATDEVSQAASESSLAAGAAGLGTLEDAIEAVDGSAGPDGAGVARVEEPTPAPPPQSVQSLDAQLAKLTDDLLAEEAPAPLPARLEAPVAVPVTEQIAAPVANETGGAPPPIARSMPTPTNEAKPPEAPRARASLAERTAPARARARSLAGLAVGPLGGPVAKLPKALRLSISVFAAYTAAMGAGAWGYIALRPTQTAAVEHAAFDFSHGSVPHPPPKEEPVEAAGAADSHGDGHGGAAKKPSAKKAPAKKPDAKKAAKQDSHGGH